MKITDTERIEQLEEMDVVRYYIGFSAKSGLDQYNIIKDYDLYLEIAKTSPSGKLYLETREALATNNLEKLKQCGIKAREILANHNYEPAPQEFDPKFISNQSAVMEYRKLIAKRDGNIPKDFKEALLD